MLGGISVATKSISQRALSKVLENHEAGFRELPAISVPLLRPTESQNRFGRKKKSTVNRDKKGKSRGEPEGANPSIIGTRARDLYFDGVNPVHVLDQLAGTSLGRLLLRHRQDPTDPGSISQAQYDAGEAWCLIVHRHSAIMGYKLSVKSPSAIMIGGHSLNAEPDEDYILRVRQQFTQTYNALQRASGTHGWRLSEVCYGVAIENWPLQRLTLPDYGALRVGLNSLVRVLG